MSSREGPVSELDVETVAVIGAGVIGCAWVTLFVRHGLHVVVSDPDSAVMERLTTTITQAWPAMVALGGPSQPDLSLLSVVDDPARAAAAADFIQECGPERPGIKQSLVAELDSSARSGVIASSSSGMLPTDIQAGCRHHPERVLVGHPFHPAHLIPLVEVVGGRLTSDAAVKRAMSVYTALGKRPIHVRQEIRGHIANRLQAALWREAYDLVARGAATVTDIDVAITNGPGLRWGVVGPFAGQHLSGGPGGIAQTLEHLGPPMVEWWEDMGHPQLTPELTELIIAGMDDELAGTTLEAFEAARDRLVLGLLTAKAHEPGVPT